MFITQLWLSSKRSSSLVERQICKILQTPRLWVQIPAKQTVSIAKNLEISNIPDVLHSITIGANNAEEIFAEFLGSKADRLTNQTRGNHSVDNNTTTVTGLSLFIWDNSLSLLSAWIEN